jgi:hypothetical protein
MDRGLSGSGGELSHAERGFDPLDREVRFLERPAQLLQRSPVDLRGRGSCRKAGTHDLETVDDSSVVRIAGSQARERATLVSRIGNVHFGNGISLRRGEQDRIPAAVHTRSMTFRSCKTFLHSIKPPRG